MNIHLHRSFIAAVLKEKAYLLAVEKGITASHFNGVVEGIDFTQEKYAWEFLERYYKEHRDHPSKELVESQADFEIPEVTDSVNFWIKEVNDFRLRQEVDQLSEKIVEDIKKSDGKANSAYERLRDFVKEQEQKRTSDSPVVSIVEMKEAVIKDYADAKKGIMGIPTPWATMNQWTAGWFADDVNYVVGGSGVGKTWLGIFTAHAGLVGGYEKPRPGKEKPSPTDTLLISCEQNRVDISRRFYAYALKKAYQAVRRGELSLMDEAEYIRSVRTFEPPALFEIKDAAQGCHIYDIERQIERTTAKLVVIDAFYNIVPAKKQQNRFENVAEVCLNLKGIAQRYRKAIVATSQITRDAKKKKEEGMGQEDVAFSEMLNHNGTNVIGIKRTEENKKANQASIYPLKVREGENTGKALIVNWNFAYMDFSEPNSFSTDDTSDLPW